MTDVERAAALLASTAGSGLPIRSRVSPLLSAADLVPLIASVLPRHSEVIVHDFARMPNSIIAVSGNVTNRHVGGPATNYLLSKVASKSFEDELGYLTELSDGRQLKSATKVLRDDNGRPVGALCINIDLSKWEIARTVIDGLIGLDAATLQEPRAPREGFARSVEELAENLIDEAVDDVELPVVRMKKHHKVAVVRTLHERGFFLIKDGVERLAERFGVTRFTIYNYLNELDSDPLHQSDEGTG